MSKKRKTTAEILKLTRISEGICDLLLRTEEIALSAKPGQFVAVYLKDGSRLLPRPISICEIKGDCLRLVFRIAGKGTEELSRYKEGESIDITGPLGNGFMMSELSSSVLIGGGIGIPPMLELAKQLPGEKTIVLGYRDSVFLADDFKPYGKVIIATEDGSTGFCGNVVEAMKAFDITGKMFFACGPKPMLKGVVSYANECNAKAQISMEEKMACGIGACLACTCKSKEVDAHTHVANKRICKDGPVFFSDEIEL